VDRPWRSTDKANQYKNESTGQRKTQGKWVVEIGKWPHRIGVAGDVCLRRSRPTHDSRANDDDDDDDV
jgi:hypothetical protein